MPTEICHIYLLELPDDKATIFKGDAVPESVCSKYATDTILEAPRHHFTAAIPADLEFPQEELSKNEAQAWFERVANADGVIFNRQE